MSYNISTWKTKRLEGFVIPLDALHNISEDLKRRGWQPSPPEIAYQESGPTLVKVRLAEGYLVGVSLVHNRVLVTQISVCGEGSGTFMAQVFIPALAQSAGLLEAVLIWEGGDSIERLTVADGEVREETVEL